MYCPECLQRCSDMEDHTTTVGALTEQFARTTYHQQVESFVAYMTNTLYRATCALDHPDEYTDTPETERDNHHD